MVGVLGLITPSPHLFFPYIHKLKSSLESLHYIFIFRWITIFVARGPVLCRFFPCRRFASDRLCGIEKIASSPVCRKIAKCRIAFIYIEISQTFEAKVFAFFLFKKRQTKIFVQLAFANVLKEYRDLLLIDTMSNSCCCIISILMRRNLLFL